MQRKVFYRAGTPILATRGDGLFETAGTLQQLIEEGRQQQRDLSQWLQEAEPEALPKATSKEAVLAEPDAVPAPLETEVTAPLPKRPRQLDLSQRLQAAEPEALPKAVSKEAVSTELEAVPVSLEAEVAAPPPKRPRQKRRRPELVAPDLAAPEPTVEETVAAEAVLEGDLTGAAQLPSLPQTLGRTALRMPAAVPQTSGQDRGKRWLMAGAARRGRAGKHWSTRQR